MRVVIALGGNALLRRGEAPDEAAQRRAIAAAVETAIAPIARQHEVIITHGNGPQIGLLALQAAAWRGAPAGGLDVLGAETEGQIGYLIDIALSNALPDRAIASLLTQVEVDPADPAFDAPSKPIGPLYSDADAADLRRRVPWPLIRDGAGWRRGVPSPEPRGVREIETIALLARAGVIVICAGGGGIPVAPTASGGLEGVDAVIDKDRTAALLAERLDADRLLILTDVSAVWTDWPRERGTPIRDTTPASLRRRRFAAGSMGPKVDAACRFVERTGRVACIGATVDALAILAGTAGTQIHPEPEGAPVRHAIS
jgi:carbamate kinase